MKTFLLEWVHPLSMYYPVRAGDEPVLFICYERVQQRNKSFLSYAALATEASGDPQARQVPVPGLQEIRTREGGEGSSSYKASERLP